MENCWSSIFVAFLLVDYLMSSGIENTTAPSFYLPENNSTSTIHKSKGAKATEQTIVFATSSNRMNSSIREHKISPKATKTVSSYVSESIVIKNTDSSISNISKSTILKNSFSSSVSPTEVYTSLKIGVLTTSNYQTESPSSSLVSVLGINRTSAKSFPSPSRTSISSSKIDSKIVLSTLGSNISKNMILGYTSSLHTTPISGSGIFTSQVSATIAPFISPSPVLYTKMNNESSSIYSIQHDNASSGMSIAISGVANSTAVISSSIQSTPSLVNFSSINIVSSAGDKSIEVSAALSNSSMRFVASTQSILSYIMVNHTSKHILPKSTETLAESSSLTVNRTSQPKLPKVTTSYQEPSSSSMVNYTSKHILPTLTVRIQGSSTSLVNHTSKHTHPQVTRSIGQSSSVMENVTSKYFLPVDTASIQESSTSKISTIRNPVKSSISSISSLVQMNHTSEHIPIRVTTVNQESSTAKFSAKLNPTKTPIGSSLSRTEAYQTSSFIGIFSSPIEAADISSTIIPVLIKSSATQDLPLSSSTPIISSYPATPPLIPSKKKTKIPDSSTGTTQQYTTAGTKKPDTQPSTLEPRSAPVNDGLSKGAKICIGVAAALLFIIFAFVLVTATKRCKRSKRFDNSYQIPGFTDISGMVQLNNIGESEYEICDATDYRSGENPLYDYNDEPGEPAHHKMGYSRSGYVKMN